MNDDFLWGSATSSHQVDGGNIHSDWWAWEEQNNIEGEARSGMATDHWNRFSEDLGLAKEYGMNSYRFSIEWARVQPTEDHFDTGALAWYVRLLDRCEDLGLVPMATLHHFSLPQWVALRGGLINPDFPKWFSKYVAQVLRAIGSRVSLWCTLNEPNVLVIGGYLGKFMPPAVSSPALSVLATRHLIQAHVRTYDQIHQFRKGLKTQVGIAHNLLSFTADRSWHPLEIACTYFLQRFYNRAWLDAITGRSLCFSVPGILPQVADVPEARGRATIDFIGVNYYTNAYVQWRPRDLSDSAIKDLPIGISFSRRKEPCSDLGWSFNPRGFGQLLRWVYKKYGIPIYITENGLADREDRFRAEYIRTHLEEMVRAQREGVDIRGYYHWSLLDNFEWSKGFKPRFGLFSVNYDTFERTPTASVGAYREYILQHPDPRKS
jgi:beta-glucosidase